MPHVSDSPWSEGRLPGERALPDKTPEPSEAITGAEQAVAMYERDRAFTGQLQKAVQDVARLIEDTAPEYHVGFRNWLARDVVRAARGLPPVTPTIPASDSLGPNLVTGELIREHRIAIGMSVRGLAAHLDVPSTMIEALEEESSPTLSPSGWQTLFEIFPALALTPRCREALDRGECDRTTCPSKQAALDLIVAGKADLMIVREPPLSSIAVAFMTNKLPTLEHYVVRFRDRGLGDAARAQSLAGFNLQKAAHDQPDAEAI